MMSEPPLLVNEQGNMEYIMKCSRFGGFSKLDYSEYPDILHTFYSLAALSLQGSYELLPLDPVLAIPKYCTD